MSILLNTKPGAHYRLRHPLKSELVRCSWARNKCALLCSRSMQRLLMLSLHVQPRGSIHLPYTRGGTSVLLFCVKNNALLQSLSSFDSFRSTTNCKTFSSSVHFLLHGPGPSSFPFRWRCWAARRASGSRHQAIDEPLPPVSLPPPLFNHLCMDPNSCVARRYSLRPSIDDVPTRFFISF